MANEKEPKEPDLISDAELIASVLDGDKERFRLLIERYQQAIFAYLYRMLDRDRETAQDLSQTVFLKAYRSLAAFDRDKPFSPWLYRIAHNEAANHWRTHSRRGEVGLDDAQWGQLAAGEESSPESHLAGEDDRMLVRRALQRLKPKYREALMLHYFEEKSYEEIAEILGTRLGTVGTWIARGRNQLREMLE